VWQAKRRSLGCFVTNPKYLGGKKNI
jgi:hypothetical protein